MKIDLCKMLGVEEGEEFKVNGKDTIYFITDNVLQYKINSYHSKVSNLKVNEIVKITKLPKKKQFSQDELCILRNIDKEYKWIARDEGDGGICIFIEKPLRKKHIWDLERSSHYMFFSCYNHLFNSIQWEDEEPVYIDDYVDREKIY